MAPAFDLFRKVPEDLQTTSVSSGIFTLLTIVVMTYLIVAEYIGYAYSSSSFVSSVVLDSHQEDLLRINFNVSIPAIPCRHLSIDLSDHLGLQFTNITRHIQRISLVQTPDGTLARHKEVFMAEAVAAWGNVDHVLHAGETITPLLDTTTFDEYMTKYDLVLVNYYAPWCPYSQALLPVWEATALQLQDHPEYAERVTMARVDCTQDNSVQLCHDSNFLLDMRSREYEFSVTSNQYNASGDVPAAVVTYDVAPLVIELRPYHVPLFRFFTSFFAIVGGAYTILKVVDAGVFLALNSMQKKAQLGKLS
ncbi:hypothetical protein B5M09_004586 [Aphanomyces astaci]|uniref:Thioredoxin domain-containing protein n=1 Tax=Aphanomyces astaci TaxID=112090 RepID=A0A425CRG8_APHAT|nr:hypothetical protein B5M09_004586 [Aphanomyces astaci]